MLNKDTLLSTVILVLVTLVLVIYELVGIYAARRKGLTKNKSRLVTHLLMVFLLGLLLVQIWSFSVRMVME